MGKPNCVKELLLWAGLMGSFQLATGFNYAQDSSALVLNHSTNSIWRAGPGDGFRKGTHEFDAVAGAGLGVRILENHRHDWAMGVLDLGWILSDVVAEDHWYRGNWELLGELFGGQQLRPDSAYFVGGGPHLRYDFAAGHRWVPFLDLGAGATATDIRDEDISTTFEFNLQAGAGAHYFLTDNLSLTLQDEVSQPRG